jgi:hypothetical protein
MSGSSSSYDRSVLQPYIYLCFYYHTSKGKVGWEIAHWKLNASTEIISAIWSKEVMKSHLT